MNPIKETYHIEQYPYKTIQHLPEERKNQLHKIPVKKTTAKKHYKQYLKLAKKYNKTKNSETLNKAMSHYLKAQIKGPNIRHTNTQITTHPTKNYTP